METLSNNATRLIGPLCAGVHIYLYWFRGNFYSATNSCTMLAFFLIIKIQENRKKHIKYLSSLNKISSNIQTHWAHGLLKEILKTGKSAYHSLSLRLVLLVTLIFNIFGFPLVSSNTCIRKRKINYYLRLILVYLASC